MYRMLRLDPLRHMKKTFLLSCAFVWISSPVFGMEPFLATSNALRSRRVCLYPAQMKSSRVLIYPLDAESARMDKYLLGNDGRLHRLVGDGIDASDSFDWSDEPEPAAVLEFRGSGPASGDMVAVGSNIVPLIRWFPSSGAVAAVEPPCAGYKPGYEKIFGTIFPSAIGKFFYYRWGSDVHDCRNADIAGLVGSDGRCAVWSLGGECADPVVPDYGLHEFMGTLEINDVSRTETWLVFWGASDNGHGFAAVPYDLPAGAPDFTRVENYWFLGE